MFMYVLMNRVLSSIHHQSVATFRSLSLLGVFLLFFILFQCLSGILLSFSLSTESMLVAVSRETEDMDALYVDDFFWLHERGVDFIFICTIFHLFRKLFQKSSNYVSESVWKSGSFMFLVIHVVIFTGLVLCCSHLSDITLKIASSIVNTLTMGFGSFGYFFYTDETLNTDTLLRITYVHYVVPFLLLAISSEHMVDMHQTHRDYSFRSTKRVVYYWSNEVVKEEIFYWFKFTYLFALISIVLFNDNEPLSYEIFMWGDIGIMNDVRFLGVAPHWYFRPFMAFLIFCPHHYFGIAGLIYIFVVVYYQPKILSYLGVEKSFFPKYRTSNNSIVHSLTFLWFIMSCLYVCSYLPYGRFFTSSGGNPLTTISFIYMFTYLGIPINNLITAQRATYSRNKRVYSLWKIN